MEDLNGPFQNPEIDVRGRLAYVPTSAILAHIFTIFFWLADALVLVMKWGSEGRYPESPRPEVSLGCTLSFSLWLLLEGKHRRRLAWDVIRSGRDIAVHPRQAVVVVLAVVLFGVGYLGWLLTGP